MRYLTALGAVTVMLGAGVVTASPAGADPSVTPATPAPSTSSAEPTASSTSAPSTSTEPTTPSTSTESPSATPTGTESPSVTPTTSASAVPAGAHQVTYTITTTSDLTANIYYVKADPPSQGAANDPKYMPMDRTSVGPGTPWTFQTALSDPTKWAFISASGGLRVNPEFHCEIAVDGKVVASQQGGSGVQCALRPW